MQLFLFLGITILFKIITRIQFLFSKYLGDYSYSFQGSSELISITVKVSLFFLQNVVTGKNSPQAFSRMFLQLQLHDLIVFEFKRNAFEKNGNFLMTTTREAKKKIKFLGRIFLGHQGSRRRDIPDKNFMQVAFFCCFRQGVAQIPGRPGFGKKTSCKKTLG